MSKFFKISLLVALLGFMAYSAAAQIEFKADSDRISKRLMVTGFVDYPPFGYAENYLYEDTFSSAFRDFIEKFAKDRNYDLSFRFEKDYLESVRNVRSGKFDLLLGMYFETDIYKGLDYVYPSILNNPITVMMLPKRIGEVSKIEDLKKLKGAINTHERLSDFVEKEMKNFDVEYIENQDELFEKLFTGKIDYIFTSYYFGKIEAARLGLSKQVAFSKQVIWDMPLFLGVSKMSDSRVVILKSLEKELQRIEIRQEIQQNMIKTVNDFERKYQGVVPPKYAVGE